MKLKTLLVALSLGFASVCAIAAPIQTPLDTFTGNLNIKLTGMTTETNTYGAGVTRETTWGIGSISQILGTGGKVWNYGTTDGSYLYYMIYGISDLNTVAHGDGTFDIFNVGASGFGAADGKIHIDLYRSNVAVDAIDTDFSASPAGRTAYNMHALLAGFGPAYLKLEMAAGKQTLNVAGGADPLADETTSTMIQNASAVTLPTTGRGSFFADVVGGTSMAQWDTNGQFGHDWDGSFTLTTNGASHGSGTCSNAQVLSGACFAGLINDPIKANKVPEPASLALFGLGLAGLAGLRRRRNRK